MPRTMNLAELKARLHSSGVPADSYSLTGGLPNERYCIQPANGDEWSTYYSERGQRTGLKQFAAEDEACEFFFQWITGDLGK